MLLYIHIPFCASRCIYCGFYSTTRIADRQRYVDALCREMELRSEPRQHIDTVYLGGGTPSQLTTDQLRQLFACIYKKYDVSALAEVTMECNPDDVTAHFAEAIRHMPVNRVSMGAQTFSDKRLRLLHRRHTAEQVAEAVERLRQAGIANISIDLMYGFPNETLSEWQADIDTAIGLGPEHLSAYLLSYEEGTPLYNMLLQGKVTEPEEELQREMYYTLKDRLEEAGYEHYEISNFARHVPLATPASQRPPHITVPSPYRSRHNSGYWNHTPYIGLGAGAHSFDGKRRQWNVANLSAYMEQIENGSVPAEGETLHANTLYNEMVMTRLRTADGLPLHLLTSHQQRYCLSQAQRYIDGGLLAHHTGSGLSNGVLRLTRQGLFVSDMVMADLMMESAS